MKLYKAIYQTKEAIVSEAVFKCETLKDARRFADFHKRHTPEITKHRYVRTKLSRLK